MVANVQNIMRVLREANNYSQEYVANVLNINQKTYSNLESGKTRMTVERLEELARLYNIRPDFFLNDKLPIIDFNLRKLVPLIDEQRDAKTLVEKESNFSHVIIQHEVEIKKMKERLIKLEELMLNFKSN